MTRGSGWVLDTGKKLALYRQFGLASLAAGAIFADGFVD
jgi:hypothetical protein